MDFFQDSSGTSEKPDPDQTKPSLKDLASNPDQTRTPEEPDPDQDQTQSSSTDTSSNPGPRTSEEPDPDQAKSSSKDSGPDQDHSGPSRPHRPHRPQRDHRPLAQSASYQPGDSIRFRSRWLQDSDPALDLDDDDGDEGQGRGHRVVLIGDTAVGKSSLASAFAGTERETDDDQDTFERTLVVDGQETTLTVMDTWDSHQSESCLLSGTAYVIVYSVADRSSFEAAAELRITLRRTRQNERLPIIVVGNKSDLVRAREVTTQEGLACAVVFDCKFIETSASLNHNVWELFQGVVRQIRLHRGSEANANGLTLAPLTLTQLTTTPRRKRSLTERARRLLDRLVSRGNHRVSIRARSKSCHDLAVL